MAVGAPASADSVVAAVGAVALSIGARVVGASGEGPSDLEAKAVRGSTAEALGLDPSAAASKPPLRSWTESAGARWGLEVVGGFFMIFRHFEGQGAVVEKYSHAFGRGKHHPSALIITSPLPSFRQEAGIQGHGR